MIEHSAFVPPFIYYLSVDISHSGPTGPTAAVSCFDLKETIAKESQSVKNGVEYKSVRQLHANG